MRVTVEHSGNRVESQWNHCGVTKELIGVTVELKWSYSETTEELIDSDACFFSSSFFFYPS